MAVVADQDERTELLRGAKGTEEEVFRHVLKALICFPERPFEFHGKDAAYCCGCKDPHLPHDWKENGKPMVCLGRAGKTTKGIRIERMSETPVRGVLNIVIVSRPSFGAEGSFSGYSFVVPIPLCHFRM